MNKSKLPALGFFLLASASMAQDLGRAPEPKPPQKFQVCTANLNSDVESQIFKSHLDPNEFSFTELTDLAGGMSDWFQAACTSGIQCDILLISGHFTGQFTGTRNHRLTKLTLEEMEKHQCAKDCPGVLKNPSEIFLFGCNTLSTKDVDSRTKEIYHDVLRHHTGLHRINREKTVESRYGEYGEMFKNRTRFAFGGSQNIYGFWSVDPTGDEAKPYIEQYFSDKKDYSGWLQKMAIQRLAGGLNAVNNDELGSAFSHLNFLQCSSMDPGSPEYEDRRKICTLWDRNVSRADKLKLIDVMSSNSDFQKFLPGIGDFFGENPPSGYTPEELKILKSIASNAAAKQALMEVIQSTTSDEVLLPLELIELGSQVGWIPKQSATQLRYDILKRAVALDLTEDAKYPVTPPAGEEEKHEKVLCDASWKPDEAALLTAQDLGAGIQSPEVLQCLAEAVHPTNPDLFMGLFANFDSQTPELVNATHTLLSEFSGGGPDVQKKLLQGLKHEKKTDARAAYAQLIMQSGQAPPHDQLFLKDFKNASRDLPDEIKQQIGEWLSDRAKAGN
jgi:hypothetical protein